MPNHTLTQQALELFLLDARARRLTPKTQQFYAEQLGWFFANLCTSRATQPRGIALTDITSNNIKAYFVTLHERGLRSSSIHASARAIKTFFNFCVREGLLAHSPFAKVSMPKLERPVLQAMSDAEIKRVLAACDNERERAVCRLMLDTGLRLSEVAALRESDVSLTTGEVVVRNGKGQKGRVVYIGARTMRQLGKYLATTVATGARSTAEGQRKQRPLFLNLTPTRNAPDGGGLTPTGLRQAIRRIAKAAGVEHCTAHTFRRTFALRSLRAGMNIYLLAKLMGHSDITVLRQYLALVEDDLREAQHKFGVVDNL